MTKNRQILYIFLSLFIFLTQDLASSMKENQVEYDEIKVQKNFIPLRESDLYESMSLFGKFLTREQRKNILITTIYNDLRLYEDDPQKRCDLVKSIWENINKKSIHYLDKIDIYPSKHNWRDQIIFISKELSKIPGTKPLERSILLNIWLCKSGLCPLVRFAFDQWYEIDQSNKENSLKIIEHLVDLSTNFLYRLVTIDVEDFGGDRIGSVAYSNVFYIKETQSVIKVPKNLASQDFAADQEYLASLYITKTNLNKYVPELLSYRKDKKVIERQYIKGKTGFELLTEKKELFDLQNVITQLREIYKESCYIYEKDGINFDIHPGNMIWSDEQKQWFLVDLGPMPQIGAEYFPRDSFENYFQKIWLDLPRLMVEVPIRSLDISIEEAQLLKLQEDVLIDKIFD